MPVNYILYDVEPVWLNEEGDYNMVGVQGVKVSEDFIKLGQNTTQCQNEKPYEQCITDQYIDNIQRECNCVPFSIRTCKHKKVTSYLKYS